MCGVHVRGYLTVIGAALIHLSFGYNYSIGNMNPYLIAYLGIGKSESVWFKTSLLACQALLVPVGGYTAKKLGFRLVTILGCILCSGGIILSKLTINYGFAAFLSTYSLLFGVGMGLPYSVLFSVASSWFPNHRAFVVGIIASGLGLGSLVFSPIQTRLINPTNAHNLSDPIVKDAVPNAFLVLGGIMISIQVLGILLCYEAPASTSKDQKNASEKLHEENYTVKEAIRSADFYVIWFVIFLNIVSVNIQSSTFKVFGKDSGLDDHYLTIIATLSSAFNCIGRIFWGLMVDRFSFKCPLGWLLIQWGFFMGTFPFIHYIGYTRVFYAIWVFALFFMMAGHFVLMPAAATRIFGPKDMATIYGLLYAATSPSSLLLAAIISQFNIDGEWITVYLSCTACLFLAFFLSTFLRDQDGSCSQWSNFCVNFCDPCRPLPENRVNGNTCVAPDDE